MDKPIRLLFIRHTSVLVPRGVCYGQTDVALADNFPEEAEKVKRALAEYDVDEAYTSPLSRCVKLAQYCGFEDAMPDKRLMEMNFGEWEMKRFDEISDPRLQDWFDDYLNVPVPGGESAMMQRARLQSFLTSLQEKQGKTIAIFTHGGILIHAHSILNAISPTEAYSLNPPYGSILPLSLKSIQRS